jgi:transcriptional regulator with GAF, ATPase, and Fis domain
MVVPIIVKDEIVGVLNICTREPGKFYDEEDLRSLQVFAENAGTCIHHSEQMAWMQESNRELQEKISKMRSATHS